RVLFRSHIEEKSNGKHKIKMTLAEEVTFFNKGAILKELDSLPRDTYLEIDLIKTRYIDHDIIEILEDFLFKAQERNIDIKLVSKRGVVENPTSFIKFFNEKPKSILSLSYNSMKTNKYKIAFLTDLKRSAIATLTCTIILATMIEADIEV